MKKFIMIFALAGFIVTGITQGVNAQTAQEQSNTIPQEKSEFMSIELADLPEEVRTAIAEHNSAATVQSAEVKILATGDYVYRVSMKSAEKGEYYLKFNSDGSPYDEMK